MAGLAPLESCLTSGFDFYAIGAIIKAPILLQGWDETGSLEQASCFLREEV